MSSDLRIYLDNAATSWPKPEAVYQAVSRYMRECGAPAGRSAYQEAGDAERIIVDARRRVAAWLGTGEPQRLIFTANGTDSLNMALHGLLRPGDHVVTSVLEHNSVLRPLRFLQETRQVQVTRVPCGSEAALDPDDFRAAITPRTRLIAMIHASNVTGAVQPVAEVGQLAREHDLLFLVDAAQSLGHMPVDINHLSADLLAAPGHKGLLGPLGTGVLYVGPRAQGQLSSWRQGGTGTKSESDAQPEELPDKFESGNHNVAALAGLSAALQWLVAETQEQITAHEQRLAARLIKGLQEIDGVVLCAPTAQRVGVVSFRLEDCDPQECAAMLDAGHRVQVRAGIHCAPLAHQALGTAPFGGTVRMSVGPFVSEDDIDAVLAAVSDIAAMCVRG